MRLVPLLLLAALISACDKKPAPTPQASASKPAASAAPLVPDGANTVPSGPRLAILAGKGLGPIRLKAKRSTVIRLMAKPCEQTSERRCAYLSRGVEFLLDQDERVEKIHVHRMGRRNKDGVWGVFNGGIPPDLGFGMLPRELEKHLGKPKEVIQGSPGAAPETKVQHVYEGMVLEYDATPSGQLILGGVRIPG